MKYLDLLYENGKAPLYISFASSGLNETDELIGVWWGDEKESACMCIEGLTEDILQKTCAYHNISFEAYKCLPSMPKEDFLVMMRRLAQHRNLFSYRLDYVGNMMKSLCGGVPNPPIVVHDLLALLSWQRTGQIISGVMPTLMDSIPAPLYA